MPTQNTTTNGSVAAIIAKAASLQNDSAQAVYTDSACLPYLQMALDELQEYMQSNNIPVTNQTSASITITAGTTVLNPISGFGDNTPPNYPGDLIEIQGIYERLAGSSDPFIMVTHREFLPKTLIDIATEQLLFWIWQDQRIKFLPANTDREVRIDYVKSVFPNPLTVDSEIGIINAKSFLQFRTAGLVARFVGENPTRADTLDQFALLAIDRVGQISAKGRQNIVTRRRPFMASYKNRSY